MKNWYLTLISVTFEVTYINAKSFYSSEEKLWSPESFKTLFLNCISCILESAYFNKYVEYNQYNNFFVGSLVSGTWCDE